MFAWRTAGAGGGAKIRYTYRYKTKGNNNGHGDMYDHAAQRRGLQEVIRIHTLFSCWTAAVVFTGLPERDSTTYCIIGERITTKYATDDSRAACTIRERRVHIEVGFRCHGGNSSTVCPVQQQCGKIQTSRGYI